MRVQIVDQVRTCEPGTACYLQSWAVQVIGHEGGGIIQLHVQYTLLAGAHDS